MVSLCFLCMVVSDVWQRVSERESECGGRLGQSPVAYPSDDEGGDEETGTVGDASLYASSLEQGRAGQVPSSKQMQLQHSSIIGIVLAHPIYVVRSTWDMGQPARRRGISPAHKGRHVTGQQARTVRGRTNINGSSL